ncbi:hypothetical protein EGW08_019990 [Elysia chlorotica]|uniref:Temptin Cys/Cys disulfide domain-containing protein n=1 Tax=Elysia chlorotica TaxID=188477 RepID=A0A3S0Z793_ELYCH|nr:hypothetical protein EGW08_019990 [Elysia chlorotica]
MATMRFLPLLVSAALLGAVLALPNYVDLIPNGANVRLPCSGNDCAVGHQNPSGEGALNAFGYDFAIAGRKWTQALCLQDSDGDGVSNGQELGDPECVWRVGESPARSSDISNPGVNENNIKC